MTSFAVAEFGGDGIRAEAETDFQGHELWDAGTRSFYAQAVVGLHCLHRIPSARRTNAFYGASRQRQVVSVVEVD